MRIGFISTYPPIECGIATYTQYLTEALRKKHTDVYIVSHMGGAGTQVFPTFDYEDGDLAEKAYSMMIRFTPDIVHIQHEFGLFGRHFGVSVVPLIIQFRLIGIPVVTTLHTVYREIPPHHEMIIRSIFANSNRIIVHESYQKESLEKILDAKQIRKISVIPHGAREVESIPDAKVKLGLPANKKVILIIGYFRPSKNFELVVDIFPEILKQVPDAILVVAGKIRGSEHIDYRNMLFNKIESSPAREHIYLIRGQLPQHVFDTILSAADVVVLPYRISSQSGILAHCLAFGKPIVTSSTEAMRLAIGKSGTGLISETREDFIKNIIRILSDEALAAKMSQNAKKYVKEKISWSIIADKHIKIYQKHMDIPKLHTGIILVE